MSRAAFAASFSLPVAILGVSYRHIERLQAEDNLCDPPNQRRL
jgi:hypothetical protein